VEPIKKKKTTLLILPNIKKLWLRVNLTRNHNNKHPLSKKSWILILPNMLPALVFLENKDSLALIDAANVDRLLKFIQKKKSRNINSYKDIQLLDQV